MVKAEARAGTARRQDYEANRHHYHHSMRSKQRQASANRRRNVELAMHLSYLRDSTIQLPAHNILDATAKYLIVAVLGIIQDKFALARFCENKQNSKCEHVALHQQVCMALRYRFPVLRHCAVKLQTSA